jgi:nucleoside-diphosphate-sugar epimerase
VRQIVTASSTAALGIGRQHPPDYLPVDEAHPLRPRDAYGLGKQMIETMARYFASRGRLRMICLRPTLIVRPEREAAILAQLALPEPDAEPSEEVIGVRPYGALSATRTYVRSADAARAFRLALDYEGTAFDVFNVAAGDGIGREETLARLGRIWGQMPEVRGPERWANDPCASTLDASRARELLGWEAMGDWRAVAEN